MKKTKLLVLTVTLMLFCFSACKSTERAQEAMPASEATAASMSDVTPEAMPAVKSAPAGNSSAINVADLVANHIRARGGEDNIRAIQTIKMNGKVEVMGMEVEMTNYVKRPDKLRSHLVIRSMNMEINQGFDGEIGWMQNPGSDPQPMPKEMTDAIKDQANIDGVLMDYADKGYILEYLGEVPVNESPAHKVKLIRPDQSETVIYLDKASYLEVKIDGKGINPQTGASMATETVIGDYRSVGGIQMAHSMEVKVDGNTFQKIILDKIEVNVDIEDEVFKIPGSGTGIK